MTATKVKDGPVFRVHVDGEPATQNRNPLDRGGFFDEGAADKLAQDINDRQARASGSPPAPSLTEGIVPPAEYYGGTTPPPDVPPLDLSEGLAPPVAHYGGNPLPPGELPPVPPGMTIATPPPPEGDATKASAAEEEYVYDDSDDDDDEDDEPSKPKRKTTPAKKR